MSAAVARILTIIPLSMCWFMTPSWASAWNEWSPDEGPLAEQVLAADGQNEWVTARRLATQLIEEQPNSYVGHHVLGRAFWQGEGDYARAVFHLKKSLKIYEAVYELQATPPWRLESEGWWSLRIVTGDMGDFEEELRLIDVYNAKQDSYDVKFDSSYNRLMAERGWALMKLGRFSEARYWAQQGLASDSPWQNSLGWNVLCATAGEEGIREEAMEACGAGLEQALETGSGIAVDASNASNAAMAVLDFAKVEEYARLATRSSGGTTVSAWINLIHLYLLQAQAESAIDAVKGALDSLDSEEPAMRLQKRADVDGAFALVLLVSGEEQTAFEKIDRALKYPDRRGVISTSEAQSKGSHAVLRWVARKMLKQREAERVAALGWWQRVQHWWASWFVDPEEALDEQLIRTILQEEDYLLSTVRPYLDKGLTGVPSWLIPDIVSIVGTGVIEATIANAREIDGYPGVDAYYQALEVEIAYERQEWAAVLTQGPLVREALPDVEQLMRARIRLQEGIALWKSGDETGAIAAFEQVMEQDPSLFRRLNIPLPTRFPIASGLEGEVVAALNRSPRFQEAEMGFTIQVQSGQVCLLGSLGQQLTCTGYPERSEDMSDEAYVVAITTEFQRMAFAMSTGLTTSDWQSLDGHATSSKNRNRRKMQELLQRD